MKKNKFICTIFFLFLLMNSHSKAQENTANSFEIIKINIVNQNTLLEFRLDAVEKYKKLINIDSALVWLQKDLEKVLDSVKIDLPVKMSYSGISFYSRKLKIEPNPGALIFTFNDSTGSIINKYKYIIELNLTDFSLNVSNYNLQSISYTSPYPGVNSKLIIYTNDLSSINNLQSLGIQSCLHKAIETAHPKNNFRSETISLYDLYHESRTENFRKVEMTQRPKLDFEAVYHLGLGFSVIQSEIVPQATLRMLFPVRKNYRTLTEVGLAYSLYVNPQSSNKYGVYINQFLGLEIKSVNLLSKKYTAISMGKLVNRQGDLFEKGSYYVSTTYPFTNKLSVKLTYFVAHNQFMPELGVNFWLE